jgi:hypothetical protein
MKKLLLVFFALIAFFACKKSSTDTTVSLDVTAANIAGTYKITAATTSIGGITTDVYNNASVFPVCSKDDIYVFNANGTYTITDAGVVCTPSNTFSGSYTVNTAAKTITIGTQTYTVVSLTNTAAVLTQTNFMNSGFPVTATYTRQ